MSHRARSRRPGATAYAGRGKPPQRTDDEGKVDDRAWSARSNMHARDVGKYVIRYMPLLGGRATASVQRLRDLRDEIQPGERLGERGVVADRGTG